MASPLPETRMDVDTPVGPGRFHLWPPPGPQRGLLVLGHGAGGGVQAPDLLATRDAALELGWAVALFEQPWKLAGGRVAPAPPRLDVAWLAAVPQVRATRPQGRLVLGGRSAGARVACRTATALAADAVCCLAFPLHPPGRPERSRATELTGAGVPAIVVQGERDPFGRPGEVQAALAGVPSARELTTLVAVPGDHGMKAGAVEAAAAVGRWLAGTSRLE